MFRNYTLTIMDLATRLRRFIEFTNLPFSLFADKAGIPRPTLSQILSGRNKKVSNEVIGKIHEAFPLLNILWLMFGDGEMVVTGATTDTTDTTENTPSTPTNPNPQKPEPIPYDSPNLFIHGDPDDDSQATIVRSEDPAPYGSPRPRQEQPKTKAPLEGCLKALDKDSAKKVAYIMVFYTDNSYEMFEPSSASAKF